MSALQPLLDYDFAHRYGDGTDVAEKLILYGVVCLYRPQLVIEIGVSAGHLTVWLARALADCGDGRLWSVDDWSMRHGGVAVGTRLAQQRLRDHGLLDRVTFFSERSESFFARQPARSADIVWVDGDHGYDAALGDLTQGLRVARHLVAAHDALMPDVRRAIQQIGDGLSLPSSHGLWLREPP